MTVSLLSLIANPERYEGQEVRVFGVFSYETGTSALYLSLGDSEHAISPNAVGLALSPDTRYESSSGRSSDPRRLRGRYVCVQAVVDSSGVSALQKWPVMLRNVVEVTEQERQRSR